MTATFKLDGLKDLNKKLKKLAPKVAKKVSRDALRAGAVVVRKEMRSNAPRDSGKLRKNIRFRIRGRKGRFRAKVGVTSDAFYAWYIEYGTGAHTIEGKVAINGNVYSRVKHPGIKPNPFLRRSWEKSKKRAMRAVSSKLWTGIEKASKA